MRHGSAKKTRTKAGGQKAAPRPGLNAEDAMRIDGAMQAISAANVFLSIVLERDIGDRMHEYGDEIQQLLRTTMDDLREVGNMSQPVPRLFLV